MVSTLKFIINSVEFQEEIRRRNDLAESSRLENFIAARKIQAWFRGILTRNHFRMLHERATIIQRHWRGYRGRITANRYLIQRVHQMWQDYYDRMAIRIQSAWRGYWTRKTCHDFQKVKKWLRSVYEKNEETLANMKKFRENEIQHFKDVVEQESILWILFILFKLHHLLRTEHRPGIITRIDETHSSGIEEMLKRLEYDLHASKKSLACEDCQIDPMPPSLVFRGTYLERCEKEIRDFERRLRAGRVPIFRSTVIP